MDLIGSVQIHDELKRVIFDVLLQVIIAVLPPATDRLLGSWLSVPTQPPHHGICPCVHQ